MILLLAEVAAMLRPVLRDAAAIRLALSPQIQQLRRSGIQEKQDPLVHFPKSKSHQKHLHHSRSQHAGGQKLYVHGTGKYCIVIWLRCWLQSFKVLQASWRECSWGTRWAALERGNWCNGGLETTGYFQAHDDKCFALSCVP